MAELPITSTTAPKGAATVTEPVNSTNTAASNLSTTGQVKANDVIETIKVNQAAVAERSNQIKAGLDWERSNPLDMSFSDYVAKVDKPDADAWNAHQAAKRLQADEYDSQQTTVGQDVTAAVADVADPAARLGVSAIRMYNQTVGNINIDTGLGRMLDFGITEQDTREYQTYMRDIANRNLVQKYLESPTHQQDAQVAEQAKSVLAQLNDRINNNYKGLHDTVTSKSEPANAHVNNMVAIPATASKLDVIEKSIGNFEVAKQLRENTATYDSLLNNFDRDSLVAAVQEDAAKIDASDASSIEKLGSTVSSLVERFWDNPLGATDLFMDSAAYTATAAIPYAGILLNTYGSMDRAQALEDFQAKHDGAMPLDSQHFANWQVANFIGGLGDAIGDKVTVGAMKPIGALTKAASKIAPESILARLAVASGTGVARGATVVGSEGVAGAINELGQQMAGIGGSFLNPEDYAKLDTKELLTQGMLEAMGSFAPGTAGGARQLVEDVVTDPRTANEKNIASLAKSIKTESQVNATEAPVSYAVETGEETNTEAAPITTKLDELQQSDPTLHLAAENIRSSIDGHLDTINEELLSKSPDGEKIMESVGSMLNQLATIDKAKNSSDESEAKLGQALDEQLSSKDSRLRKFAKLFEITTDDEQFVASLATQQAFDKIDSFSEEDLARVQQLGTKVLFAKRFDNDESVDPINQVFLAALQTVMEVSHPDSPVVQAIGEYAAAKTMAAVSQDIALADGDPKFVGATTHINRIVDGLAVGNKGQVTDSYARLNNLLNSQLNKREFLQKAIQVRQNEIDNGIAETTQKVFENPQHLSKDGKPLYVGVGAKGLAGASKLLNQVNKEVTLLASAVELADKLVNKKDTRQANLAAQTVLSAANQQNTATTDTQWQAAANSIQPRADMDVTEEDVAPSTEPVAEAEQLPLDLDNPNEPTQLPLDFEPAPTHPQEVVSDEQPQVQEAVTATQEVNNASATATNESEPVTAEQESDDWTARLTDVGTVAEDATVTEGKRPDRSARAPVHGC